MFPSRGGGTEKIIIFNFIYKIKILHNINYESIIIDYGVFF